MTTKTAVARWQRVYAQSLADVPRLVHALVASMIAEDYSGRDVFGMRLALEEAIVNGIKHGHRGDATKRVRVCFRVTAEEAIARVEDEGPGFDPARVPDPLAPENLERPGGRGLLLMRTYLTSVRYSARGNVVTLCQARSTWLRE